jgi:uncharacterized protein
VADLHISWTDYHQKIEQLALQIAESGWQFEQVLCLARGGLRIGDIFSRFFHKPLAILSVSSYSEKNERDKLKFGASITMTTECLQQPLLLVDDLVDSGETLKAALSWLDRYQSKSEVRTAVIWYKACSIFTPDYYVEYLPDNPWIHQPFEIYENMSLEKLKNNLRS